MFSQTLKYLSLVKFHLMTCLKHFFVLDISYDLSNVLEMVKVSHVKTW